MKHINSIKKMLTKSQTLLFAALMPLLFLTVVTAIKLTI